MIICPNCKEEIDNDSHYCDQCGQALAYCCSCGRVGIGKRCTYCGGRMGEPVDSQSANGVPSLTLNNASLGIRIVAVPNAVIGRKQGPYKQFFECNMYVSGLHATLLYEQAKGWGIVDKNSSNGTKVNHQRLQPEQFAALKDGDVIEVANVSLLAKLL